MSKIDLPGRHWLDGAWCAVTIEEIVLEYLLLIHTNPAGMAAISEAERNQAFAAYAAYTEALGKAEVLRGSNRLRPASDGTTVRMRDGKTEVHNGPFAETREELGGYYLIDVPDLDVAMKWATRCPAVNHGSVEVRPVWARGAA